MKVPFPPIKQQLLKFLTIHHSGDRYLVAVSGGVDSIVLMHACKQLNLPIVVGHVDHGLRKSSHLDATFVERLAKKWEIPFFFQKARVHLYARKHQLGIEEAAREVRYQALIAFAKKHRCQAIVTAHHAGDQAETVLMRLLRGAGPAGLSAMQMTRTLEGIALLRPFLATSREEILAYAQTHHLEYREDASNANTDFFRNKIRHDVLPYLEKLSPGVSERLTQLADIVSVEESWWDAFLAVEIQKNWKRRSTGEASVDLPRFLRYHKAIARRLVRWVLGPLSFREMDQLFSFIQSTSSSNVLPLSAGRSLEKKKQMLYFKRSAQGAL